MYIYKYIYICIHEYTFIYISTIIEFKMFLMQIDGL